MIAEYKSLLDLDSKVSEISSIININFELVEIDNELNAAKKYYNEHIVSYNKLIRSIPSNIVAKLYHYTVKDFYSDEKIEIFEILKEKQKIILVFYFISQLIGFIPLLIKKLFVLEKGLLPKNPLQAENGDG